MADRSLVSQRRVVTPEQRRGYDDGWEELTRAVEALGAHAWRFVSANNPALFMEFLEFRADADPRGDSAVRESLRRLDREAAPAEVEEWSGG